MTVIEAIWQHTVSRDGTTSMVALSGEIDLSVHEAVQAVLTREISRSGVTAVRADLSQLSFLDSSAIHALVQAKHTADELGRDFTITDPKGPVRQVLELTGLLGLLHHDDTDSRP